jgi:predicted Zn finger-like uncharacterized protein
MALLTSCPQCHTTFRISEDALRKAAGQVRCGRCSNIFNAHAQLRDSEAAPKPRPAPAPAPVAAPAQGDSAWPKIVDLSTPDPELRIRAVAPQAEEAVGPNRPRAPSPEAENPVGTDGDGARDFGIGSDLGRGGDFGGESAVGGGSDFSRDDVAETILSPAPGLGEAGPSGVSGRWTLPQFVATLGPDRTRLWKLGISLASGVLLVQVVNSFSDVIATRVPLVQSIYAAFGVTLVPRWDLDRYEVLGATAATSPGTSGRGNLIISARIRNRGTLAQPYPHVQLRLLDRWERTVGRRAFTPANYSATSVAPDAMLAPGASVTAELVVVDPGPNAAGFEIDICVDGAVGLRCDGDDVFE